MTHAARGYESVDPAPPAPEADIPALEARLLNVERRMFDRMRALFTLRAIAQTDPDDARRGEAIASIGRCLLEDRSALLRHEAAFIFGQVRDARAVPALVASLARDPHPMVRHESAEALGAIGTPEVEAPLRHALQADADQDVRDSAEVALDHIAFLRDDRQADY